MNEQQRAALTWYAEETEALAKHMQGGAHTQAVLASLTVLSLDGGSRARAALAQPEAQAEPVAWRYRLLPYLQQPNRHVFDSWSLSKSSDACPAPRAPTDQCDGWEVQPIYASPPTAAAPDARQPLSEDAIGNFANGLNGIQPMLGQRQRDIRLVRLAERAHGITTKDAP